MCLCRSQQPLVEPALLVSTVGGTATKPVTVLVSPFPLSPPHVLLSSQAGSLLPWEFLKTSGLSALCPLPPALQVFPRFCLPRSGVLFKSLLECHFIPRGSPVVQWPRGGPLWSDKGEHPCYLNMQMHPPMRLLIPLLSPFFVIYHLLI